MNTAMKLGTVGALLIAAGCASIPNGPSVMVMPGSGKSFDAFRADDMQCRQFASSQVGGATANDAIANSAVESAAIGTAVGAAAGALMGGHRGAGVGAGTGLLFGAVAGSGASNASGRTLQQRYDIGYTQCMYAKGNQIPVAGRTMASRRPAYSAYPQYTPPPPPPPSDR